MESCFFLIFIRTLYLAFYADFLRPGILFERPTHSSCSRSLLRRSAEPNPQTTFPASVHFGGWAEVIRWERGRGVLEHGVGVQSVWQSIWRALSGS